MKKILIICLIVFSCMYKAKEPYFTGYNEILNKKDSILNLFGKYEYSPDGKDSVWVKTLFNNKHDKVIGLFKLKEPLDSMWNVYLFNAKKYDTFPLPTMMQIKNINAN